MRSVPIAAIALVLFVPAAQADDLAELLKRVPGDMNTVAVVNVREINKTPRAVKEKWRDNHETEYLAGAISVPPWVTTVVVGAELQPGALARGRSLALVPVENALDSRAIARQENGVVESADDLTLVLSPKRGYFGFPAPGIIGLSSTMPRQDFARWARSAHKPDRPAVSEFLQEAVNANKAAHIIIAVDLRDMFDPVSARVALQQSGAVSGDAAVTSLTAVLAGARGLVFTGQVGDTTRAQVRIDFSTPMADFLPAFRKLWPKALERAGLEVDEFKTAEPKADGKTVVLTADLSDNSLRRILSLVAAPGDAVPEDGTGVIRTPKEAAEVAASLRFYKAVNTALDDLRADGGAKGKDYVRSAAYFDNYAAKIEKFPQMNVDPVLVQYGASVAAKLRGMADSLRGVKVQLDTYDNYKSTTWAGGGGAYVTPRGRVGVVVGGNSALSTNAEELSTRQAELVAKLEPERAKIWNVLQTDRSEVRKEMLEKYKIDFEQYKH